ncbi:MAG: threonine synthase [Clostridia bacterium]|nr:threonine synthase [Clostridia bacterium]
MRYLSTKGGDALTAAEAIVQGISPSGGLYVPESFPALSIDEVLPHAGDYRAIAKKVFGLYLTDFTAEEVANIVDSAYGARFDTPAVAPTVKLNEQESVLELWHGPTLAFKDMALQALPHLMRASVKKTGEDKEIFILVATSGDTGKAALEGFRDVEGTRVLVFYPHGGVSAAQRLQMVTQEGGNMDVCAVRGNFDDAQTGVKRIFGDPEMKQQLAERGVRLSSANSINFGRLLPQIVYYYSSYADAVKAGSLKAGEKINFCVPTGNFGDILAGYYAMKMGLPVNRLICASNRNNVLTDFFRKGVYDANRPFYKSMSCSIDILISSNLERLVYEIAGRDEAQVRAWMDELKATGRYEIGEAARKEIGELFYADWCTEEDTLETIKRVYDAEKYLMDPHTGVAQTIYERYVDATGDKTHTVVLSTANPFKFGTAVLGAFEQAGEDDFVNADRLSAITGVAVCPQIAELLSKPELHTEVVELIEMPKRVLSSCEK